MTEAQANRISYDLYKAICFDLLCNTSTCTVLVRVTPFLNFTVHTYSPLSSGFPLLLVKERFPLLRSDTGFSSLDCSGFHCRGTTEREKSFCGEEAAPEDSLGKNCQWTSWTIASICFQVMWEAMEQGMVRDVFWDVYWKCDNGGERSK